MTYTEAQGIKRGDMIADIKTGVSLVVLDVLRDADNELYFRCIHNGDIEVYHYSAIREVLSVEEQTQLYLQDANTRVYIKPNNDTGKWLFSVVVENSDDFWLDAFDTVQEAIDYIETNGLQMVDDEPDVGESR